MATTVTAKQLRYETSRILQRVRTGERLTVTLRGKPVAVLTPLQDEAEDRFEPIAFGLWKERKDLEDVQAWLDKIRQPRYRR
jgi:prevent-host-death family protein